MKVLLWVLFVKVEGQKHNDEIIIKALCSHKRQDFIDDFDINKVELYSLRRQIGIVPQEPLLFSGTIRDNISINQENATDEEIILASKIACAHQFIMELSEGYNSQVGERGSSLSGGQKQR